MNIDKQVIQETYKDMSDFELIKFAETEGQKLSADGFILLCNELRFRDIGHNVLEKLEHEIILQESIIRRRLSDDIKNDAYKNAIDFALSGKENGISDLQIVIGLTEKGIPHEDASAIVKKIEDLANDLSKDSKLDVQAGIGMLILGVIAIYVSIEIERFVLPAMIIPVVGITKILISYARLGKYNRVLTQIQNERL